MASKQLPWTEVMTCTLLHLVIAKGVHLISGKGVSAAWEGLNKDLFENEEFKAFKADHFKEGGFRKVRDKFDKILVDVQKDIDSGNQSGKYGEQSELYKLVKQIKDEIDEKEDEKDVEKEATAELKRKLEENEDSILGGHGRKKPTAGWGVRKGADGNLTGVDLSTRSGGSTSSTEPARSFDQEVISFMRGARDPSVTDKEEIAERSMLAWIQKTQKTVTKLITESGVAVEVLEKIEEITIEVLVSIYCSRGENFIQKTFKTALVEEGISTIATHKLYRLMQAWRIAAEEDAKSTTPVTRN